MKSVATILFLGLTIIAGCAGQPVSTRQPATAPAFHSRLHVTEQVICQLPDEIIASAVSPRQLHFAYVCPKGDKKVVVLDGAAGPEFDEITSRDNGGKTLHFSRDEKHLAYAAMRGGKWLVVNDGIAGDEYDHVLAESIHFDDKGRLVYAATSIGSQFRVVNGKAMLISTQAGDGPFVESGGHVAYVKKENGKEMVVLDGNGGPRFDEIDASSLAFKSGGDPVYVARRGKRWCVVQGDKPGEAYDKIEDLQIAPGGKLLTYHARRYDTWFVVVNDHPQGPYDSGDTVFSDDGKHLAFVCLAGDHMAHLVVDGKSGDGFADIDCLEFSPDGEHLACGVELPDGAGGILIDGNLRRRSGCRLTDIGFSGDGRHVLAWGIAGGKAMVFADDRREGPFDTVFVLRRFGQSPSAGSHLAYVAARNTRLQWGPRSAIWRGLGAWQIRQDGGQWFVVVDGWAGPTYDRVLSAAAVGDDGKARYLAVRSDKVLRVTMDLPAADVWPPPSAIP